MKKTKRRPFYETPCIMYVTKNCKVDWRFAECYLTFIFVQQISEFIQ